MIKGIGCDVTKIDRVERLMSDTRFIRKVFTPAEQSYVSAKSVQTAAGLWAAKEAVSKALGTGFDGFSMRDIEIGHDRSKPYVKLHNGAQKSLEQLCGMQISISISHEENVAIAFAVIE